MKRAKVTVKDIRAIQCGQSKVFHVNEIKDLRTAQAIAYRVARWEPELGVVFSTEINFDKLSIKITAEKA